MRIFSLSTYEDYILNTVVKSSYAKNSLTLVLLCLLTSVLKFHLSVALSVIITTGGSIDLISPIFVSLFVSMISETLFGYVKTHEKKCEALSNYLIENYSKKNFLFWKRCVLSGVFCYVMLILCLITIDNYFVVVGVIQTAISFAIWDCLENGTFTRMYYRIINYKKRKPLKKVPNEKILSKSLTPPKVVDEVEEQPGTPPRIEFSDPSRSPTPERILPRM